MHFGFITFRIQKQKKMVTLWGMKNEKKNYVCDMLYDNMIRKRCKRISLSLLQQKFGIQWKWCERNSFWWKTTKRWKYIPSFHIIIIII